MKITYEDRQILLEADRLHRIYMNTSVFTESGDRIRTMQIRAALRANAVRERLLQKPTAFPHLLAP